MNEAVGNYMTKSPMTINATQNLKFAASKMKGHDIRHLPVLDSGKLVGIITDRDINYVQSFEQLNPEEITVEDACSSDPYIIDVKTSVKDACKIMADKKYGSVLVEEDQKLVGIFTWIDALKIISEH